MSSVRSDLALFARSAKVLPCKGSGAIIRHEVSRWTRSGTGRGVMYRSVVESRQEGSERRRIWRWAEGIAVAAVVAVGVTYLFGLISF